ncbi:uncharacterized protein LOC109810378, partial [Cajanus cajan]
LTIFHYLCNSFFVDLDNVWFAYDQTLILEVCDETQIAELRLKVGETEMHLKRTVGVTKAPMANSSPTTTPPVPTKPVVESVPSIPPPSPAKSSPFVNDSLAKSSKLAALDASGSNNYVVVSSPTVGAFRRYRIVKGKRQPPVCKEVHGLSKSSAYHDLE